MRQLPVFNLDSAAEECRCDGGQPKNFARPCLLLLLAEAPAHGYELLERLREFGFDMSDPGFIYKTLRQMEREALVVSEWELSDRGPARRVYRIMADGRDLLESWTVSLAKNRAIVSRFLERYSVLDQSAAASVR